MEVFNPSFGNTSNVTNATSATSAVVLPSSCDEVALSNTSETARVHVYVTPYTGVTAPTGTAPTTSTGMPVMPNSQIRVAVGFGPKVIRTIATAADGNILITPGRGV